VGRPDLQSAMDDLPNQQRRRTQEEETEEDYEKLNNDHKREFRNDLFCVE